MVVFFQTLKQIQSDQYIKKFEDIFFELGQGGDQDYLDLVNLIGEEKVQKCIVFFKSEIEYFKSDRDLYKILQLNPHDNLVEIENSSKETDGKIIIPKSVEIHSEFIPNCRLKDSVDIYLLKNETKFIGIFEKFKKEINF